MNAVFNNTEKIIFELRSIYSRFGYVPYRMGKFEEYDLYSRNKDFLVSDSVITFTDTNGKLMALKPDVTLSIIKNNRGLSGETRKLFYNENVYRVSKGTNTFREIMQAGAECIGDIDAYAVGESLYLAALSLHTVSEDFVLDVSSLDILLKFVNIITDEKGVQDDIIRCAGEKNPHGILSLCRANGIDPDRAEPLLRLLSLYGTKAAVGEALLALCTSAGAEDEARDLFSCLEVFDDSPVSENVQIDFSVVSDRGYYNGVIFKGFVEGVPNFVLSGGQYDKLMKKMHRKSRAVGFAVYLDMLERVGAEKSAFDVDILLLYDESERSSDVRKAASNLIEKGSTVLCSKSENVKLTYRRKAVLSGGEVKFL